MHDLNSLVQRKPAPIVASYGRDLDSQVHSMLGLTVLADAMNELGVGIDSLLEGTGVSRQSLLDPHARMSHRQKILLFGNVQRLMPEPGIGLRAGQRQRISDYGVYGYALLNSATFGDAVGFGVEHLRLAGPVLEKSFHVQGEVAIFEGNDVMDLGPLLPLVSEFWFSSMCTLMSHLLERPFKAYRLQLPYPAPGHAELYEKVLHCPVEFDSGVMRWEFDAALLAQTLPNANPVTAVICSDFCDRMMEDLVLEPALISTIKTACLNSGKFPNADEMAQRLHVSTRTLHRRLGELGVSYQSILDGIRMRLSVEFLERTSLSVESISERTGFADVSNFRKAFKKWTGRSPAYYRERQMKAVDGSAKIRRAGLLR